MANQAKNYKQLFCIPPLYRDPTQETRSLGNKVTDKMLSIPPTIKVPMGERLNVFVEQDLHLRAYKGQQKS